MKKEKKAKQKERKEKIETSVKVENL